MQVCSLSLGDGHILITYALLTLGCKSYLHRGYAYQAKSQKMLQQGDKIIWPLEDHTSKATEANIHNKVFQVMTNSVPDKTQETQFPLYVHTLFSKGGKFPAVLLYDWIDRLPCPSGLSFSLASQLWIPGPAPTYLPPSLQSLFPRGVEIT